MRVTARFDFPGGVTVQEAENIIRKRLRISRPLADLMVGRLSDGRS